jgi:hypothetical protein
MTIEVMKNHKINNKHKRCTCSIGKLIHSIPMNKHMKDRLIKASDPNEQSNAIHHYKVNIIKDFKETKNTKYETKVYELKERLRIVYYDEYMEKKEKTFKLAKCGLEAGKQNAFLEKNKLTYHLVGNGNI